MIWSAEYKPLWFYQVEQNQLNICTILFELPYFCHIIKVKGPIFISRISREYYSNKMDKTFKCTDVLFQDQTLRMSHDNIITKIK